MAELTKRQRKRERKRRRMRFEKSPPPARQPPAALAPPPQSTAEKRQFASSPDRQTAAGAGARAVPQPEQERETALSAPALSRVPASAGARYFRGRRHLPLLGLRHWVKQTELDARCAPPPPPSPLRAPQPPFPPHARIPHLPAALHASLQPHPLLPLCCAGRSMLPFYLHQGRGRRAEAAAPP